MTSLLYLLKESNSSVTCNASSRVGTRINPCTGPFFGVSRSRTGSPNAAVLPVPVCACAIISLCLSSSNKTGMVSFWIGEGVSKPLALIAGRVFSPSPSAVNSSNCVIKSFFSRKNAYFPGTVRLCSVAAGLPTFILSRPVQNSYSSGALAGRYADTSAIYFAGLPLRYSVPDSEQWDHSCTTKLKQ